MIAFIRYVSFHLHYAYIMTSMWLKGILESKNFCLVRLGTSCGTIRCTIQFQHRTTFGIVGVIIMSYLRWSSWAVTVLILICKVIRLSSCRWVHFLYLCQRFTHPSERHHPVIRCTLCLTICMNKAVQLIILITYANSFLPARLVDSVCDVGLAAFVIPRILSTASYWYLFSITVWSSAVRFITCRRSHCLFQV